MFALAQKFAIKYKIAEIDKISVLWNYPNKLFNILRVCADISPKHPKTEYDRKAIQGHEFCRDLLAIIDYLQANRDISKIQTIEALHDIISLIQNQDISNVSEMIFQVIPISKKHDIKLRNDQFAKAKKGISRILDLTQEILSDFDEYPLINKHENSRASVSEKDIISFVREHSEYGIKNLEDWRIVTEYNPELKNKLTTVINALKRGHSPKDAAQVRMEVAEILKNQAEKEANNSFIFDEDHP